jgi:hypothetical protein
VQLTACRRVGCCGVGNFGEIAEVADFPCNHNPRAPSSKCCKTLPEEK